jgi:type II secretory pathway component PulJ
MTMSRRRSHGMLLLEVLFLIGILAMAMVVEAWLFRSAMRATESAPLASLQHARLDGAIAALRADVWNAWRIDVRDPGTIALQMGNDTSVVWRLRDGGASRTAGNESRCFAFAPALTARPAPGGLALADAAHPQDFIQLSSQLLLIGDAQ